MGSSDPHIPAKAEGGPVSRAIGTVRDSILLRLAVAGVLLILIGFLIRNGVWAAILPTWGAALILLGVLGYAYIWWKRQ